MDLRVVVACSSAVACRQVPQLLEYCRMFIVGVDQDFNYCLTTKIEVSKQSHRWAIDVIWLLTVHLCPVGPRVLDTCSLNIRAIHIREDYGTPLSQSLIHSYFLGPQTSLRFYLRSCTYAMLYCFIYDCARSTLYCLGKRSVFAVSTIPVLGSQSFTAIVANLESVSESASFVAGLLNGVAP